MPAQLKGVVLSNEISTAETNIKSTIHQILVSIYENQPGCEWNTIDGSPFWNFLSFLLVTFIHPSELTLAQIWSWVVWCAEFNFGFNLETLYSIQLWMIASTMNAHNNWLEHFFSLELIWSSATIKRATNSPLRIKRLRQDRRQFEKHESGSSNQIWNKCNKNSTTLIEIEVETTTK